MNTKRLRSILLLIGAIGAGSILSGCLAAAAGAGAGAGYMVAKGDDE
ncbi:MAG TPA: hypothetical protein VD971_10195 [Phycisphaerales bacterium]|nr:hypothetical protein [Phycisphaerales bacterium]